MVVERGSVTAFRRAIGLDDDGGPEVPPTYAVVADQWDPDFSRRPPLGRGWVDGLPETLLHVEQWFEHQAPLVIGEELVVRRGPGRRWERDGRSGRLEFVEERTELVGSDGVVRVATGWIDVRAEVAHRDLTTGQRADDERPVVPVRPTEVVLVDHLTPTQIVMYVGASGDLHPLHHDRAMALSLGYPDVFAPGMLTMALTTSVLAGQLGSDRLGRVTSRFRAQVWPGDSLCAGVTEEPDGTLVVRTRNQFDEVVLDTTAVRSG
jgi:acyl dehydratase